MILIIGHGFLGSAIFADLTKKGYPVKLFSRSMPQDLVKHNFIGKIEEIDKYENIFNNISTIIHTVHTSTPYTSSANPIGDAESNVIPFLKLLNTLKKTTVNRFIYLSSGGAIYGQPLNLQPMNEDSQTNPISPYGISKLLNEKHLIQYGNIFSNGFTILRPSNIYGPGQKTSIPQGIIGHLIRSAFTASSINIWGDGESRKDYLYLDDFLEGIKKIISEPTDKRNGIFNIAFGKTFSINELIHTIEKITCKKIVRNYSAFNSFDVPNIALDNSLFCKTFAWKPTTTIEEGIKQICNNLR